MNIISLSSTVILAMAGTHDAPPHADIKTPLYTNSRTLEQTFASNSNDVKISSTAYLPPVNRHKVFEEFRKTQFYADVYEGKSLGEFIRIEE